MIYCHIKQEVEITLALNKGWTNGTFQLDSTGSSLVFGFYHLDSGFSTTFKRGVLKGPFGEECVIFLLQSVTLYPADCESITVFEVLHNKISFVKLNF